MIPIQHVRTEISQHIPLYSEKLALFRSEVSAFVYNVANLIEKEQYAPLRLILRTLITSSSDPQLKQSLTIDQLVPKQDDKIDSYLSLDSIKRLQNDLLSHTHQILNLQKFYPHTYTDIIAAYQALVNLCTELVEILSTEYTGSNIANPNPES